MPRQRAERLARRAVPEADQLVAPAGGQLAAAIVKDYGVGLVGMCSDFWPLVPRFQFDHAERAVIARRGDQLTIRRIGGAIDLALARLHHGFQVQWPSVIEPQQSILAS